jgi:hypothetical protein
MANDGLLPHPSAWPRFQPGDDLSGSAQNPFFVRLGDRFVDVARELGLGEPQVSRGIAVADVDGDGDLDFAVANQWGPSTFHRNECPRCGAFLGLHLLLPLDGDGVLRVTDGHPAGEPARPAVGAHASVQLPDGRRLTGQVDGGSGHSGKKAPELHFGLGAVGASPLPVELRWRDPAGQVQTLRLALAPGWHTVRLGRENGELR